MFWTEEAIETLKALAAEGRSARAIAEALGAPSRSAVIGKANRVGVKLNGSCSGGADRPRVAPRAKTERGPRLVSSRPDGLPALRRETRRRQWIFAEAEVGDMLRLGLEEIGEANCKWPVGDPLGEEFAYCGLPSVKGRSYCAGHCRMSYQPPKGTGGSASRVAQLAGAGTIIEFPARTRPERQDILTAGAPKASDADVFSLARRRFLTRSPTEDRVSAYRPASLSANRATVLA
jgi:GcrA cell cycle regulator